MPAGRGGCFKAAFLLAPARWNVWASHSRPPSLPRPCACFLHCRQCVIGDGVRLSNCVLLHRVKVKSYARVADSIVGWGSSSEQPRGVPGREVVGESRVHSTELHRVCWMHSLGRQHCARREASQDGSARTAFMPRPDLA